MTGICNIFHLSCWLWTPLDPFLSRGPHLRKWTNRSTSDEKQINELSKNKINLHGFDLNMQRSRVQMHKERSRLVVLFPGPCEAKPKKKKNSRFLWYLHCFLDENGGFPRSAKRSP